MNPRFPAPILTLCTSKQLTHLAFWLLFTSSAWGQSIETTEVGREIDRLTTQIDRQQDESEKINGELTKMERQISELDQKAYTNEQQVDRLLNRLQTANKQKEKLDADIETQRSALAQQLVAMYTAGDQSYLRLLLRQDNPSDISRTLRYFEYLNAHRTTKISAINAAVDKVQALTNDMEKDRLALTSAEQALTIQKKSLQDVVASREDKLKNITSDIRLKRTQVERLREQAAKLQTKFDELAANSPSKEAEPAEPEPIDTQPEKLPAATASSAEVAQRLEKPTTQEEVTSQFSSNKPFSTLKKQLSVPVSGQIIHTFNSEMNEKQKWQGIVIAAANGSKVRAVAPGKVAYTGQMDGYGFLTIIEHDHNYMTLYAYNRANYKKVGDSVNAGDVIAAVGNSGGQEQDALYFEIRKRGAVQNPAQWLR